MTEVTKPAATLICCPHAGGTVDFFRDWPRYFPTAVEVVAVQYPGHGDRLDEACLTDVHDLVAELVAEVDRLGRSPLVLFGHSFGAAVAYEAAVRLTTRGTPPHAVLLSARVAPHHDHRATPPRSDAEIWDETVRLGGTAPEISTDQEWRELLTPQLRADYQAAGAYRPSRARLPCPLTALLGRDDDLPLAKVDAWREYTEADFALRVYCGAHFYLTAHVADIANEVARLTSYAVDTKTPTDEQRSGNLP